MTIAGPIRFVLLVAFGICALAGRLSALGQPQYIEFTPGARSFRLAQEGTVANLFVDAGDYPGVRRAAGDLQADLARVTGDHAAISNQDGELAGSAVLIGTLGKSRAIDRLVQARKIDASAIAGKWESFLVEVVDRPWPGLDHALVIAGSDKRGTIYGIYDVSEQIGVSPWYWWADVPVAHHDALYVKSGKYLQGEPAVRYRGIFLNDEAPALTGWAQEKFGGLNHQFYEKVFELLLRLKANYLWPAMWANAFNEDDPFNPKLADEYGIVMGTSHHEPMLRAQQEWKRHGKGKWDYNTNAAELRAFWEAGIRRNKDYESIITIGMRGDGDLPMNPNGDMASNIALLEKVVADQRAIIARDINPDPAKVPQLWALYKEVQGYYEHGMRVPDDVTLLWSDDNWGNLRRLPTPEERKRSGGAGIYYHFDYVGGPRSYKWLNTIPITKVWEQMNLAYQYGANRIWIVNVGDLKPMEFPIEFFLSLAWNPQRWTKDQISEFTRLWAEREFGPAEAPAIADIVSKYTKYNGRRKPELLAPDTFSLENYQEADRVAADWEAIVLEAEQINQRLPDNARDAFFQLVLYPVKASAQVNELYLAAGKNRVYAAQGRASANDLAAEARALFHADADWSAAYNHRENGKWDHMMDQTHIGYTSWRDPPENVMPAVTELQLPQAAAMGVAVEGSASAWPGFEESPVLPKFDAFNRPRHYIDVFNRGRTPFVFTSTAGAPWIVLSQVRGNVDKETRVWVSVDWSKAPAGSAAGAVTITGAAAQPVTVKVESFNPREVTRQTLQGFVEADGYVSVEAAHFTRRIDTASARWEEIPDYGRTLSSTTVFPVTTASAMPPGNVPSLEYRMYLFDFGSAEVDAYVAPTLDFVPGRGQRFAVSFDDQPPQVVDALAGNTQHAWEESVKDSIRIIRSSHMVAKPGYHVLKIWMVDPGLVLQKIVVDLGGVKPSYLGPPESFRNQTK